MYSCFKVMDLIDIKYASVSTHKNSTSGDGLEQRKFDMYE